MFSYLLHFNTKAVIHTCTVQYSTVHSYSNLLRSTVVYNTVLYTRTVLYCTIQPEEKARLARLPSPQTIHTFRFTLNDCNTYISWSIRILRYGGFVVVVVYIRLWFWYTLVMIHKILFAGFVSGLPGSLDVGGWGMAKMKDAVCGSCRLLSKDGLSHVLVARLHKHCLFACCFLFFFVCFS